MRVLSFIFLCAVSLLSGCEADKPAASDSPTKANAAQSPMTVLQKKQFPLAARSKYPTVGLKDYVLITDDLERDRAEVEAVIQSKIELPHAMQTKERKDFEPILAANFVFRANDQFFDRDGYIADRVGDPSKVKQADYRNVVVQFISGERALVTYSNIVEDQPGGPGSWKADMTWADILVKEDGKWKYETVHLIEFKDLTVPK